VKSGAPGRAPGRPALPSSQTGRRAAVRAAVPPGDAAACGRPGRAGGPSRRGARVAERPVAGGAGGRRWGRPATWSERGAAGKPAPLHPRSRALPRPASRTRVPFPRHHAPARGASACSAGVSSARGTCVRQGTRRVGRNAGRGESTRARIPLYQAEYRAGSCNGSCSAATGRGRPSGDAAAPSATAPLNRRDRPWPPIGRCRRAERDRPVEPPRRAVAAHRAIPPRGNATAPWIAAFLHQRAPG
jgi:hypothetical protein